MQFLIDLFPFACFIDYKYSDTSEINLKCKGLSFRDSMQIHTQRRMYMRICFELLALYSLCEGRMTSRCLR